MSQGRNEPCSCGSGRKYKNCCESKTTRTQWYRYAAGGAFALIIAVGFVMGVIDWMNREPFDPGDAPPGKVWSEEHQHWHDVAPPASAGSAPPGKVWSPEHQHWHDAPAGGASTPAPPGPPPPGKVWSTEHGHWHDAPGTAPSGSDAVDVDSLPPLEGTETSPAPVSEAPADANG